MKIPFDIKFKPQIESGEYKVETRDGHPARIICWDANCYTPMVFLATEHDDLDDKDKEYPYSCNNFGRSFSVDSPKDLFIITPEEEMSEFAKACMALYNEGRDDGISGHKLSNESVKESASELLTIAKKEIGTTFDKAGEYLRGRNDGIEYGKAEALKDLPRWKFYRRGTEIDPFAAVRFKDGKIGRAKFSVDDCYVLEVEDMLKLPGFND